jgi:hypothetical protein
MLINEALRHTCDLVLPLQDRFHLSQSRIQVINHCILLFNPVIAKLQLFLQL